MLSDLDLCNLCQAQYDGAYEQFDTTQSTSGVDWSAKIHPDCSVIVFEGSHDLPDWISNMEFRMVQVPDFAGVEHGFNDGLPDTFIAAERYLPKENPVYVTGHSRGAAHALIFAALLVKQGYKVICVTFGAPRAGDAQLAAILSEIPCRSYQNFHSFDDRDFVCTVPMPYPFGYIHCGKQILIDVPPEEGDPWLLLARHHCFLYQEGVASYGKSNPG